MAESGHPKRKKVKKIQESDSSKKSEISPTVKKLKGFLKNHQVSELDYKKFLERKYLL